MHGYLRAISGSLILGSSILGSSILVGSAAAQVPASAPRPPVAAPSAQSLDSYAEAAATTIIAEQSCAGVRLNAGQLTTLRLAARVGAGQEASLEEKLRSRASQLRQQLAADGRDAWCAAALAAYGPDGSVVRGVLAQSIIDR